MPITDWLPALAKMESRPWWPSRRWDTGPCRHRYCPVDLALEELAGAAIDAHLATPWGAGAPSDRLAAAVARLAVVLKAGGDPKADNSARFVAQVVAGADPHEALPSARNALAAMQGVRRLSWWYRWW